jgi:hypothetical protein
VYRRELDEPAEGELAGLSRAGRKALTEFMDAVVIIDPAEYQRRPGEQQETCASSHSARTARD